MEKSAEYIWYNGKFVKWQEANTHVLNYGLHYGCGAFEGVRVYNGKAFSLRRHIERLRTSAKVCNIDITHTDDELIDATTQLIAKNKLESGYIRPITWLGCKNLLLASPDAYTEIAIACWPSFYNQKVRPRLKLTIATYRKAPNNAFPNSHKTTASYMVHSMIKKQAKSEGFDDALILDQDGYITEASTSNFFVITDSAVITPSEGDFLPGITRHKIIELCKQHNITIIERKINVDDLVKLKPVGAFITGTAIEMMEVQSITTLAQQLEFKETPTMYNKILQLFQGITSNASDN